MVLAISFIEAPLKFRAPGVTIRIGLGIGRIVFLALNIIEFAFSLGVAASVGFGRSNKAEIITAIALLVVVWVQLAAIRPWLNRKTRRVLASTQEQTGPRSHAHLVYVGLEVLKVAGLLVLGVLALGG
jgi:hypothetical protein